MHFHVHEPSGTLRVTKSDPVSIAWELFMGVTGLHVYAHAYHRFSAWTPCDKICFLRKSSARMIPRNIPWIVIHVWFYRIHKFIWAS
jgi:K+ transporter